MWSVRESNPDLPISKCERFLLLGISLVSPWETKHRHRSINFRFWDSSERFFEAPTLNQATVKFFLISKSINNVSVGYFHIKYGLGTQKNFAAWRVVSVMVDKYVLSQIQLLRYVAKLSQFLRDLSICELGVSKLEVPKSLGIPQAWGSHILELLLISKYFFPT